MAGIQPVLSTAGLALADRMAELTGSKRTGLTGGRVVARKRGGEEGWYRDAELAALECKGNRLRPGIG